MTVTSASSTIAPFKRVPLPAPLRCLGGAVFYGVIRPGIGLANYLGLADRLMSKAHVRRRADQLKKPPFGNYVPGEHDVIVATYAKSGTNWMMQIAHQLAFHGKGDFEHVHCVVPWPDSPPPMGKYAIPVDDPRVWMASPERKRVIKTHLDWDLIPYSESARYIAVIRDPKDVFVSNYFFSKSILGAAAFPRDLWYRLFVSGNSPVGGSWAVNTAGYWAQRHQPNVLVLSFKQMKQDLPGTVRRVAEFMNVRVSQAVLDEVAAKASFEYMKKIDAKFGVWKMFPWGPTPTMIRKGGQGASSELLSPVEQREIDTAFQTELRQLNSDFPYEEFCDIAK
jgi:hypothetical protein